MGIDFAKHAHRPPERSERSEKFKEHDQPLRGRPLEIQRVLEVGASDDRYEREADTIAAQVVRQLGSSTDGADQAADNADPSRDQRWDVSGGCRRRRSTIHRSHRGGVGHRPGPRWRRADRIAGALEV